MALTVAAVLPATQNGHKQQQQQQQQSSSNNKARSIMSLLSRLGSTSAASNGSSNNNNNADDDDDEIETDHLEWDDIACQFELNDEQEEDEEDAEDNGDDKPEDEILDKLELGGASAGVAKALKDARNRQKMSVSRGFKKSEADFFVGNHALESIFFPFSFFVAAPTCSPTLLLWLRGF